MASLRYYRSNVGLGPDEKFALRALIVASLDDALEIESVNPSIIEEVRRLLIADLELCAPLVRCWSLLDQNEDMEGEFAVTPLMKELLPLLPHTVRHN